ncbi:hypothetical protein NGB36_07670 [Streptomyces sp. RB6PN25]|uniref:Uncharacterized protein n=1 Tax=Streptomyces humicola TaxID=2953240 RepID=A0ABT1PV99_9ACTN|nr:hypothetical protein [Streptomyces humicola]MCQ4080482.1 hypothetical protein [Streptomyces humicola]
MHRTRFAAAALVAAASAMSTSGQAALADPPPVDPTPTIDQQVVRPGSTADLTVFCSPMGQHSTMIAKSPAFAGGAAKLHRTYIVGMAWKFEGRVRIAFADDEFADRGPGDQGYGYPGYDGQGHGGHGPQHHGRFVRQPVMGHCPGGGDWRTIITVDRQRLIPRDTGRGARAKVRPRVTHPGGRVTVWVHCPGYVFPGQRVITAGSRAFSQGNARLFHLRRSPDFRGQARIARRGIVRHRWGVFGVCPDGAKWHATFSVVRGPRPRHHHGHRHDRPDGGEYPGMGPQLGAGGTSGPANSPEIAAGGLLAGAVIGAGWMVMRRYRTSRAPGY